MTDDDRDDIILAIYIQLSRIYDLLLVGPDADRKAIADMHQEGKLLGPIPALSEDTPDLEKS